MNFSKEKRNLQRVRDELKRLDERAKHDWTAELSIMLQRFAEGFRRKHRPDGCDSEQVELGIYKAFARYWQPRGERKVKK